MKTYLALLSLCLAAGLMTSPAQAQTVFGSGFFGPDGPASLYSVNAADGTVALIGAMGFERCGAMDFDPSGTLFAHCERSDGSDTGVLITVNLANGAGTEVGPTGLPGSISDISFRGDGTLFAYDANNDPTHALHTINPATGVATLVGQTGLSFAGGNAMGFNGSNILFHSQSGKAGITNLSTLDQVSALPTLVGTILLDTLFSNPRFNSMDFDAAGGQFLAILNNSNKGGGSRFLMNIDPTTLAASTIGQTGDDLDGIAVLGPTAPEPSEIPSLSPMGLALLALLLTVAAAWTLRRRMS